MAAALSLGRDLALTRYTGVASSVTLEVADSWGSLDLAVSPARRIGHRPPGDDLGVVDERANLAQALILRLVTPRGSLAGLGHATYGSRLGELIGRRNDETARNRARLATIEAVGSEQRCRLLALDVTVAPGSPDAIRIALSVEPVSGGDPLGLALEVQL